MGLYSNIKEYELRYSDFDFRDRLKLSCVLELAQESAAASADELGFGYSDLKPRGLGFITVHTYCEFKRSARLGERVKVETWPLPPRHVIFERDSRMIGEDGSEIAAIASRWCLVDLNSFAMQPPERLGEAHARCPYRAEKTTEIPARKIARISEGSGYRAVVRNSLCDHYLHANNAKYADLFLDCFTMDELAGKTVRAFSIAYHRQAKEGMELTVLRRDNDGGSVCEALCGEELIAQMSLSFKEEGV